MSAPPANIAILPQPVPLYMIGESHCMAFRDRLLREDAYFHKNFLTKGIFIPTITAHNFTENGQLHQPLIEALMGEMLMTGGARGWTPDSITPAHVQTKGTLYRPDLVPVDPYGVPTLVFFVGEIALRSAFLRTLGKRTFDLPFEVPGLAAVPTNEQWERESEAIPFQQVVNLYNQVVGPFFQGLVTLYNMGFSRLYIHSVPPPTLDDREFEWMNGFYTPARLRYKGAHLFNRGFAQFCSQTNVGFLDIWDDVTEAGALRPDFYLDGCHLHPKSAPITLRKLTERLASDSRHPVTQRYELALEEARSESAAGSPADEWQAAGVATGDAPSDAVKRLRKRLKFDAGVGNVDPRLDWNGAGLVAWSEHVHAASLSTEDLQAIFELLYDGSLSQLIQGSAGYDVAAISVRCLRFELGDEQDAPAEQLHREDEPPGVLRCVVYLTDVDGESGGFEYRLGDETRRVSGAAGTAVLFDGKRVEHRWVRPGAAYEVLDMTLTPRHKVLSRCVVAPGMNNWPVDPYNFSVEGFALYPDEGHPVRLNKKLSSGELMELRRAEGDA